MGGANKNLSWCRNPILALMRKGRHFFCYRYRYRCRRWANMKSHSDAVFAVRVLGDLVLLVRGEASVVPLLLARRPKREESGAFVVVFINFQVVETVGRR